MDMTEAEFIEWRKFIRGTAVNICRKWAYRQWESLLDDCEGAGWLAITKNGLDHPFLHFKIIDAIHDEIRKLVFHDNSHRKCKIPIFLSLPLRTYRQYTYSIETLVFYRQVIKKILQQIENQSEHRAKKILAIWKCLVLSYKTDKRGTVLSPFLCVN